MNRTAKHLACAIVWLLASSVIAVVVASPNSSTLEPGRTAFYSQVASISWLLGFVGIFFSWARVDAPSHGKSVKAAVVFAALWPFFIFITHIAYLFFTRGFRGGALAAVKFVCFLLAAAIVWLASGRLVGAFL